MRGNIHLMLFSEYLDIHPQSLMCQRKKDHHPSFFLGVSLNIDMGFLGGPGDGIVLVGSAK